MCEEDTEKKKNMIFQIRYLWARVMTQLVKYWKYKHEVDVSLPMWKRKKKQASVLCTYLYSYLCTGEVETDIPWDLLAK